MERLTERTEEGQAIPRMDLRNNGHSRCLELLARYEDTELTPEGIQKLKEQVPQWIPVGDRLPERSGWYLVWTRISGIPWVRYFSASKQKFFDTTSEVLAWMPLPEMYKEENNEP